MMSKLSFLLFAITLVVTPFLSFAEVRQLTFDQEWAEHPSMSADGNFVAFETNRSGVRGVCLIPIDGQDPADVVQLVNDDYQDGMPVFHPDGINVTFTGRSANMGEIWTVNRNSLELTGVVTGTGDSYFARYSADGSMIYYVSNSGNGTDIWRIPSEGGDAVQITFTPDVTEQCPVPSPDGTLIAFHTIEYGDVFTIPADGGETSVLVENAQYPSWSPDGTSIAYQHRVDGNNDIWFFTLADSSFTRVTTDPASDFNCDWSGDGSTIVFTSTRSETDDIWIVDVPTSGVNHGQIDSNISDKYVLLDSYPNPFNPSTTISIDLKESSFLDISIFDTLGREVAQIANSLHSSGHHEYSFNGSDITSGIYFVKVAAPHALDQVRKIVLTK